MPFPWVLIPAAISAVAGLIGQRQQKKANQQIASQQNSANQAYLQQQLEYNTPKSQMLRFQEAGLNPHLIYGQGNPGSQSQPLTYPDIKPTDMQSVFAQLGPMLNQSMLAQSQVQMNDARIRKTGFDIQLNKLQQAVLAANPLLDKDYFSALVSSMLATAESKQAQAGWDVEKFKWLGGQTRWFDKEGNQFTGPVGIRMMEQELANLIQRFDLGEADKALKAEVLKSKEFQNAILEVQSKFMTEGDITPEDIRRFIMLLLTKLL